MEIRFKNKKELLAAKDEELDFKESILKTALIRTPDISWEDLIESLDMLP